MLSRRVAVRLVRTFLVFNILYFSIARGFRWPGKPKPWASAMIELLQAFDLYVIELTTHTSGWLIRPKICICSSKDEPCYQIDSQQKMNWLESCAWNTVRHPRCCSGDRSLQRFRHNFLWLSAAWPFHFLATGLQLGAALSPRWVQGWLFWWGHGQQSSPQDVLPSQALLFPSIGYGCLSLKVNSFMSNNAIIKKQQILNKNWASLNQLCLLHLHVPLLNCSALKMLNSGTWQTRNAIQNSWDGSCCAPSC